MEQVRWIWVYLNVLRVLPAYFCLRLNRFREKCEKDLDAWIMYEPAVAGRGRFWQFGYLLIYSTQCVTKQTAPQPRYVCDHKDFVPAIGFVLH